MVGSKAIRSCSLFLIHASGPKSHKLVPQDLPLNVHRTIPKLAPVDRSSKDIEMNASPQDLMGRVEAQQKAAQTFSKPPTMMAF